MTLIKRWTSPPKVFLDFGPEKFENGKKFENFRKIFEKFFFSKSIQNHSKRILNRKSRKNFFLLNVEFCSFWDICQNIASNTRLAPKPEHSIQYPSSSEPNARLCPAPVLTCSIFSFLSGFACFICGTINIARG